MPLFGSSRREPSPPPITKHSTESSRKHTGIFHRRSDSTASSSDSSTHPTRRQPAPINPSPTHISTKTSRTGTIKGSLFGKRNHADVDPSVLEARERVEHAEAAEMEADRALEQARLRVREARENMRIIELEAKEEMRKAQIKQHHAQEVLQRGKGLGRHGE